MRVINPGEKISAEELKYFAKMAAEAYLNDPVHSYATKNVDRRRRVVYHFMMERLSTSNGQDYFYIDDERRGVCVWRKAHNEYTLKDFLKCPHWIGLWWYWPNTLKTLLAYSPLDVHRFDDKTWIISPVFVAPEHQGKGIATELIRRGISDLTEKGFGLGLEAQDDRNVAFYKKLGFEIIGSDRYDRGKINHFYMIYNSEKFDGDDNDE